MNTSRITIDDTNIFAVLSSPRVTEAQGPGKKTVSCQGYEEDGTRRVSEEEALLIQGIKAGDEAAFNRMIDLYHSGLLRLARTFLGSEALAEEVVQDTWVCVLEGIHRFEGRSSLKTWVYRILMNQAKTRSVRENRYVALNYNGQPNQENHGEAIEPGAFYQSGSLEGSWTTAPTLWDDFSPERLALSKEALQLIQEAMDGLPPIQKQVLILRDVEGLDSKEVCRCLHLTETNQRVLLHRARGRVRRALDGYIKE